jgi:ABC-type dipeptide/oligopeptide/nickel transport system permease component
MLKFAARRFAQAVLVVFVSTFVMYVGVFQLGDPFKTIGEKLIPPDHQAMLRSDFGLDKPFYLQYLIYVKNLFTGRLGIDFDQRRPVWDLLTAVAPNTARLAILAIAINVVIGVLAGVAAAVWKDSFWDALVTVSTILLLCVPIFALGVALRSGLAGTHLFGIELFPTIPRSYTVEVPWYKEILLPAFTLAVGDVAFIARLMRASMLDVLHQDYLNTARGKGLTERRVVLKHAVRNALIPVVNHVGIAFGALLGGTLIVETIFQYRGLGYLFIRSLESSNSPVILAIAVYAVITFVVIGALADVLCAYLDPRIRLN